MNVINRSRIRVLVIDCQSYWREYAAETLRRASYQVSTMGTYEEVLASAKDNESWNIVLLGCANVRYKELFLVTHLIARHQSVVVLSTALTTQETRHLFLQGVEDATDKTYHPAEIVAIVEQAQKQIFKQDRSWELMQRGTFL